MVGSRGSRGRLIEGFVGRAAELAVLERVLDDVDGGPPGMAGGRRSASPRRADPEASGGASRFVVVTGEPGIGKTRLLTELIDRADERGCLGLDGSAAEFERDLPFGVAVDAFDAYLESLGSAALDRLAADGAGDLAAVFPSLRSLGQGAQGPATATERFRVYHAVRELLERLAASRTLVVVLDDLHWADSASLELVGSLLRRPPQAAVLIALAYRTGRADPMLEAAIDRAAIGGVAVERLELGPMRPDEVEPLVPEVASHDRARLYRESGGNPFYLLQLARFEGTGTAARRGVAPTGGGVPELVAASIGAELDGLSATGRMLAQGAAVAGDPFEIDLATAAAALDERAGLAALDELVAQQLVAVTDVPRQFRFRHPLVRHAVYASCAPGARLEAHRRVAGALEARGAPTIARAHHVEQSARHGDLAAVAVLVEAGEAAAQGAPAIAAGWFEAALRLLPTSAPAEERVRLLTAYAGAVAATGRFGAGRDALVEALTLVPDDAVATRVGLITACAGTEQLLGRHEEAHDRLTRALDSLPDRTSREATGLMITLAVDAFFRTEYGQIAEWAMPAVAAAERLGDRPLTAVATAILALGAAFAPDIPAARAHRDAAAELVDAMSDDELAVRIDAASFLAGAELYLDRYEDGIAHAQRSVVLARRTGQGQLLPTLIPTYSAILFMSGRLADAAELLDDALEGARLANNTQSLAWALFNRAFGVLLEGDLDAALAFAEESVAQSSSLGVSLVSAYTAAPLANTLLELGRPEEAVEVLTTSGGEELWLIPGAWRAYYLEKLASCWLALGRTADAEVAAGRAQEVADQVGLPLATAMAHRAAAALAMAADDPGTAADRALASVDAADSMGARVEAGLSRILAGRALAQLGERDRATAVLERAVAELDDCGAKRYCDQAAFELRKLGRTVHRRTRPGSPDGTGVASLTGRELEVARLVVDRLTNREIAAELFLSLKTVESHMRNILHKLGASSRVQVARIIEREAERATPAP